MGVPNCSPIASYTNPIVLARPSSYNGAHADTVRIVQVQNQAIKLKLHEPPNLDGGHTTETVDYLVVEKGVWQLTNGKVLEAGSTLTSATVGGLIGETWQNAVLSTYFPSTPVGFSQVQSNKDTHWVKTRQKVIQTGRTKFFSFAMEEEEAATAPHAPEYVGWLAVEPTVGTWSGLQFQAGLSSAIYDHQFKSRPFSTTLGTNPRFLASLASYNFNNPCDLRYQNLQSGSVSILVEEDTTWDEEVTHGPEAVAYMLFSGNGL